MIISRFFCLPTIHTHSTLTNKDMYNCRNVAFPFPPSHYHSSNRPTNQSIHPSFPLLAFPFLFNLPHNPNFPIPQPQPQSILFLFLSSTPLSPSSSPSRSAVSAGFSKLCTLLAILLLRVGGAVSIPLKGKRAPGNCQPESLPLEYPPLPLPPKLLLLLSRPPKPTEKLGAPLPPPLPPPDEDSWEGGGEGCRDERAEARGSSYCARASRICWLSCWGCSCGCGRRGDEGQAVEFAPEA
jgi:hypothetical protein